MQKFRRLVRSGFTAKHTWLTLLALSLLVDVSTIQAAESPVLNAAKLPPAASVKVEFARDIEPIFKESCLQCHGPKKAKSGFQLDSAERALAGGDTGADIIPGNAAKSPLVYFAARVIPDLEMPPKAKEIPSRPRRLDCSGPGSIRGRVGRSRVPPRSQEESRIKRIGGVLNPS